MWDTQQATSYAQCTAFMHALEASVLRHTVEPHQVPGAHCPIIIANTLLTSEGGQPLCKGLVSNCPLFGGPIVLYAALRGIGYCLAYSGVSLSLVVFQKCV